MSEVETGQFTHTLEEIDSAVTQVTTAKGDYPTLAAAIGAKQDSLTFDETPTKDSTNAIFSGGVFPLLDALKKIVDKDYKVNVLQNTGTTATIGNEVTFTVNADGSITATVIATTTAQRNFDYISTVPSGTWWFSTNQPLSGGTANNPCYCAVNKGGTARSNDFNPEKQTLVVAETTNFQFRTVIRSGVAQGTVITFYPMLCDKTWYDISSAFVPYSGT